MLRTLDAEPRPSLSGISDGDPTDRHSKTGGYRSPCNTPLIQSEASQRKRMPPNNAAQRRSIVPMPVELNQVNREAKNKDRLAAST